MEDDIDLASPLFGVPAAAEQSTTNVGTSANTMPVFVPTGVTPLVAFVLLPADSELDEL